MSNFIESYYKTKSEAYEAGRFEGMMFGLFLTATVAAIIICLK